MSWPLAAWGERQAAQHMHARSRVVPGTLTSTCSTSRRLPGPSREAGRADSADAVQAHADQKRKLVVEEEDDLPALDPQQLYHLRAALNKFGELGKLLALYEKECRARRDQIDGQLAEIRTARERGPRGGA